MWISIAGIHHKEGFSVIGLRMSRKQDHVANLGQIGFSNSCPLSPFWIA